MIYVIQVLLHHAKMDANTSYTLLTLIASHADVDAVKSLLVVDKSVGSYVGDYVKQKKRLIEKQVFGTLYTSLKDRGIWNRIVSHAGFRSFWDLWREVELKKDDSIDVCMRIWRAFLETEAIESDVEFQNMLDPLLSEDVKKRDHAYQALMETMYMHCDDSIWSDEIYMSSVEQRACMKSVFYLCKVVNMALDSSQVQLDKNPRFKGYFTRKMGGVMFVQDISMDVLEEIEGSIPTQVREEHAEEYAFIEETIERVRGWETYIASKKPVPPPRDPNAPAFYKGKQVFFGKRGGRYYLTESGKKAYLKANVQLDAPPSEDRED